MNAASGGSISCSQRYHNAVVESDVFLSYLLSIPQILRLSGESSRSTTAKGSSAEYRGRNVPRDLLVKLIRGAVGSASADQQNSVGDREGG